MHPNPIYRSNDQAIAILTAQERGFGILTVTGPDGVLASHVPFVATPTSIRAHLVRSNPIARLLMRAEQQALMIVSGPDGYVSPDWYGLEDQVPTWNYVAVHLRGTLRALPAEELRGHLEDLSARNETRLPDKKPWTLDKNQPETLEKLMHMIVPVEMAIESVDSTFKLGQNKPEASRLSAAEGLAASPLGHEQAALAALMRGWADH